MFVEDRVETYAKPDEPVSNYPAFALVDKETDKINCIFVCNGFIVDEDGVERILYIRITDNGVIGIMQTTHNKTFKETFDLGLYAIKAIQSESVYAENVKFKYA